MRPQASLVMAWDHWCHFLQHLRATESLDPAAEDDARHLIAQVAKNVSAAALDFAALGAFAADALWQFTGLAEQLAADAASTTTTLPTLWWSPRDGELALTCLDAAPAIGATLREFGGVVFASATLSPIDSFAIACGLDTPPPSTPAPVPPTSPAADRLGALTKRDTKKLYRQLTTASALLRVEEAHAAASPAHLRAHTPWREGAYTIAFDARVDTTYQNRARFFATTAATIASLHAAAGAAVAIFFPSYAYAETIARELATVAPALRVALQPKLRDLAAQSAWVDESMLLADALFLVLGSSFAESIDTLGGRLSHAMVVGPALPEVNAVQRARLDEATRTGLSREEAFRRVYQIPGMTKVNQALGRLVRAPGQRTRVVLHCRRFLEPRYASLLAPDYQLGTNLHSDADLESWLA